MLVDLPLGSRCSRVRRHLPLFQWSNPSVKDHLGLFTHGVLGQWTIPKKTGREYSAQVTAEEREDCRGRYKVPRSLQGAADAERNLHTVSSESVPCAGFSSTPAICSLGTAKHWVLKCPPQPR